MATVKFLTTQGCYLCEQAWQTLQALVLENPVVIEVVDIAEDGGLLAEPDLMEKYGHRIPLLRRPLGKGSYDTIGWPVSLADLRIWLNGYPRELEREWYGQSVRAINESARLAAAERQLQLTKPPGSLGKLEQVVIDLAGQQGREQPSLERVAIAVFAGDHGVVDQGVSAFPQAVTVQMMANFVRGGAAISVLAESAGCRLDVLDMGTCQSPLHDARIIDCSAGRGTADMSEECALTRAQLDWCLAAGAAHIDRLIAENDIQLFIAGEMGIGNTTSAAAICCALLGASPEQMTGRGTGLNDEGLVHKQQVVQKILDRHQVSDSDPLQVLQCLGGFELAAITGAVLRCAQKGISVLVDGYIVSAAVLVAVRLQPDVARWLLWSHQSVEPGHTLLQEALGATPLVSLDMRLGEASGAAVVLPLLRAACTLHRRMSTFVEAGISGA